MRFNVKAFLESNRIHYVLEGPNVASGNVNIKCPFCGPSDPSEHLGISLKTGYWGCWRSASHRGKNPVRLIMRLIGCSVERAREIAGVTEGVGDLSKFEKLAQDPKSIFSKKEAPTTAKIRLSLPTSFKPIGTSYLSQRFREYLAVSRKFSWRHVTGVIEKYDLRYCVVGRWRYRVILPVYFHGKLVTWTGRSILPDQNLRYQTLSHKPEKAEKVGDPLAVKNIKHVVFNYGELRYSGGEVLVLTEGPMDALKIDYFGEEYGIRGTCLFSTSLQPEQEVLVRLLAERFKRVVVLFDSTAYAEALGVSRRLSNLNLKICKLPQGLDDPGAFSPMEIKKFLPTI